MGLDGRGKVTRPMRVTYVCSNLTLAAENRQKLAVFDQVARNRYVQEPSFGRLLELAVKPDPAAGTKLLEVCSRPLSVVRNEARSARTLMPYTGRRLWSVSRPSPTLTSSAIRP